MATLLERWRSAEARATRIWNVLSEGVPGLLFVLGIGASGLVGWVLGPDLTIAIRYGGTLLQVLGLLLVARGLDRTRAAFGRPTMTARVRAWAHRLLTSGRPRNVAILVGTGEIRLSGAVALAHGRALGASLDRRIEMLEQDVERLRKDTQESTSNLRQSIETLKAELVAEVQKRTENNARVEHLVSEVGVGGLHLEWIGLLWLVLATVCTALPEELAGLLN